MEEFTPVAEKSTKKVWPWLCACRQPSLCCSLFQFILESFNNFSNFQGSALIICLALLGKSMNEIEKNEFLKMELETDTVI